MTERGIYYRLPVLLPSDLKNTEYSKASILKPILRDAINCARMRDSDMAQIIHLLEEALAHIRSGEPSNPDADSLADDGRVWDSVEEHISRLELPNIQTTRSRRKAGTS